MEIRIHRVEEYIAEPIERHERDNGEPFYVQRLVAKSDDGEHSFTFFLSDAISKKIERMKGVEPVERDLLADLWRGANNG